MRFFVVLAVAVLAVCTATDAQKNAAYNKMLQSCEDLLANKITKDEAVKQVAASSDGLSAEDKKGLAEASGFISGLVSKLGDIPAEHRVALKGACGKSKPTA